MSVRAPAVAGLFYPDDPRELAATVDALLAAAPRAPGVSPAPPVKAIVAPHAGYAYSGPIAAHAYVWVAAVRETITRVVVLGPAHRVALDGIAVPTVDAFRTPLADVPVDAGAVQALLQCAGVGADDRPHEPEHSIEVHLPFLQRLLRDFTIVPLVVGHCPPPLVADALAAVWGGPETLIVVSTDLSHYEPYTAGREHDRATAASVLAGNVSSLGPRDACGVFPLRGLARAAHDRSLTPALLDLRSSGDTAGSLDRVVGYGAFAYHEAPVAR